MHLADSAFPIGASSHSYGIETLATEGSLRAAELEAFLADLLWESGLVEALFARLAYRLASGNGTATHALQAVLPPWLQLNQMCAAMKGARESRNASATLGRRFLQTVAALEQDSTLQDLYQQTIDNAAGIHYCTAFGFVGGHLCLGEEETILAYLQQNTTGLISASLRLLPIGQGRAGEILWRLKTVIAAVAEASVPLDADRSANSVIGPNTSYSALAPLSLFTPLIELGSMRHPTLHTRLFIS